MRRTGRFVSSLRQPIGWLIVAGALVVYVAYVLFFDGARPSASPWLPWWAAQALPPLVYGVLVRFFVPRVSPLRWMVATCLLWAVNLAVGVLTSALGNGFGSFSIALAFPPPPWPAIFWVPLLLVPLRDPIAGDPRSRRRRSSVDRRVAASQGPAWMTPRPVTGWPVTSAHAPERDGSNGKSSTVMPAGEARIGPLDPAELVEEDVAPENGAVGAMAGPVSGCLTDMLAPETSSAHVRVSLDRIAGQLPAEAFLLPLEQVGPALSEPGRLLVPQRLVLAQLSEGHVSVGWDVVASQFPRQTLAMTDEDIAARLPNGHVVLPLDEVVPQLPPDLFAPRNPLVHLEGIENFPAPFRASAVEERPDELANAFLLNGSAMSEPAGATRAPAAEEEWLLDGDPSMEGERLDLPLLEDVELDPHLMELDDAEPVAPPVLETATSSRKVETIDDTRSEVPLAEEADEAPVPSARGSAAPWEIRSPVMAATPAAGLTAPCLAPASDTKAAVVLGLPSRVDTREMPGLAPNAAEDVELVTTSLPGPCPSATVSTARLLLPLLAEGRSPWAVSQLTLRGPETALILTPLGPIDEGASVLVSTVTAGESLALAEFQALRAANDRPRDGEPSRQCRPARAEVPARAESRDDLDPVETESPSWVREIAADLDAIGPVAAGTLRHAAAAHDDSYLFLPRGSDVRKVGRFAREVERAMRKAAESGHTFQTAVVRSGNRRLIIQALDAGEDRPCLVVAGGETDRPGLAYHQVACATRRLGAR